jgi:hypothetical protein
MQEEVVKVYTVSARALSSFVWASSLSLISRLAS